MVPLTVFARSLNTGQHLSSMSQDKISTLPPAAAQCTGYLRGREGGGGTGRNGGRGGGGRAGRWRRGGYVYTCSVDDNTLSYKLVWAGPCHLPGYLPGG